MSCLLRLKGGAVMSEETVILRPSRVYIFVDFWNVTLNLNTLQQKSDSTDFKIDWKNKLRDYIMSETVKKMRLPCEFQGMLVCGSYDSSNSRDANLKRWAEGTLDKFYGVTPVFKERQQKEFYAICPSCLDVITSCPKCGARLKGTVEKGVDTEIASQMLALAWNGAYDVAVLASDDKDFVPVVKTLRGKGIKVIHARPSSVGGQVLDKECFDIIELGRNRAEFDRTKN